MPNPRQSTVLVQIHSLGYVPPNAKSLAVPQPNISCKSPQSNVRALTGGAGHTRIERSSSRRCARSLPARTKPAKPSTTSALLGYPFSGTRAAVSGALGSGRDARVCPPIVQLPDCTVTRIRSVIAPTRELVADVAAVFAMIDGRANVGVSGGVEGARGREEDFGIAVTGGGSGMTLANTPGSMFAPREASRRDTSGRL